ncbi:hypothetical protein IWQ60_001971 [Tieghemiomyces parasiticus]|uniref:NADH dehydrogenase [ubiquinone] 1 alpha subcomplex subunit n=1 Tax=Tieghemiomyces parasiticus TaxID=78921 RepID=A0A9W8DW45_9FUNG|nr:hypothetical protein IWQ60_001971 [Tieghemiomyces parasiticus]
MSQLKNLLQAWRSVRLPWRRTSLAGKDHFGNSYFEKHEKEAMVGRKGRTSEIRKSRTSRKMGFLVTSGYTGHRPSGSFGSHATAPSEELNRVYPRRWVELTTDADHYSQYDVNRVPVQWQSWLRHTRFDAPSDEEIARADARRELIKQRAKELDLEWSRAKPLDEPQHYQPPPSPAASSTSTVATERAYSRPRSAPTTVGRTHETAPEAPHSTTTASPKGHTYEPTAWKATPRR